VDDVSVSTIWRWLAEDTLRPWRYRSWIFPRDPGFAAKAGVVLDLYARRFQGRRLVPGSSLSRLMRRPQRYVHHLWIRPVSTG